MLAEHSWKQLGRRWKIGEVSLVDKADQDNPHAAVVIRKREGEQRRERTMSELGRISKRMYAGGQTIWNQVSSAVESDGAHDGLAMSRIWDRFYKQRGTQALALSNPHFEVRKAEAAPVPRKYEKARILDRAECLQKARSVIGLAARDP
jgi:hypothetical protein